MVPSIKPDSIIQIHGRNGVGKSMAATMLEIASGNYTFQNEGQFNKLKNVIDSCKIAIKVSGEQERYEVKLTPSTWKFNQSINGVNPMTTGNYSYNGKEIKLEDFKKKINIRVIRGDESLSQQISFFKDIFTSKISQKLETLERSLQLVEGYKERLDNVLSEQEVKEYTQKNDAYNKILDKNSNLETAITYREQTLLQQRDQVPLLNQLRFIAGQKGRDHNTEQQQVQGQLDSYKKKHEAKVKEKIELEEKRKELQGKFDAELQDWINKKESFEKKSAKLKDTLRTLFDAEAVDKLLQSDDLQASIKYAQGQIEMLENNSKIARRDLESLSVKNERVLGINGFLVRVEEFCNQIQGEPFAGDAFIRITGAGGEASISPNDLREFIKTSKQVFSEDKELKQYESKVAQANKQLQTLREQKDALTELEKVQRNILALTQKIESKGANIAEFLEKKTTFAIQEKLGSVQATIDGLNEDIASAQAKLASITHDAEELSTMPSENVIRDNLSKVGCTLKDITFEACSKKITEVQKEIVRNEHLLEDQKKQLDDVKAKFDNTKQDVELAADRLKGIGKKFGYSQLGPFLDYYNGHIQKMGSLIGILKDLISKMQSLQKDLEAVVAGKNAKNARNGELIVGEFDRIFREMYGQEEFFKYVFKEYTSIKRFDIKARTIVFETKTGLEEMRDLNEFSSGEKTYAYCRAIIAMMSKSAEHSIIILDESYALLDHEHSQDLYEFKKREIKEGGIAKFINILPLKEDLEQVVAKLRGDTEKAAKLGNDAELAMLKDQLRENEAYLQEVQKAGYYQRVIKAA
jgi:chromosome segregation ATPase